MFQVSVTSLVCNQLFHPNARAKSKPPKRRNIEGCYFGGLPHVSRPVLWGHLFFMPSHEQRHHGCLVLHWTRLEPHVAGLDGESLRLESIKFRSRKKKVSASQAIGKVNGIEASGHAKASARKMNLLTCWKPCLLAGPSLREPNVLTEVASLIMGLRIASTRLQLNQLRNQWCVSTQLRKHVPNTCLLVFFYLHYHPLAKTGSTSSS